MPKRFADWHGSARAALATALLIVGWGPGAAAEPEDVACVSSPGQCTVLGVTSDSKSVEIDFQVQGALGGQPFNTTLSHSSGRALTVAWEAPSSDQPAGCQATIQCENGRTLECQASGSTQCGSGRQSLHCGSFSSGDELLGVIKSCRLLDEPWPDWPKPRPQQRPPPPPPPPPPPGDGSEEEQDPGEEGSGEKDTTWWVDVIRRANLEVENLEYEAILEMTTVAPRSSASRISIRHEPDRTWMLAEVFDSANPTRVESLFIGDLIYFRMSETGPYLEINRGAPTGTAAGGFMPPGMRVPTLQPTGIDHEKFGPTQLVAQMTPDNMDYLGEETCGGSPFAGVRCHLFEFLDDGKTNEAYFSVDTYLLESVVGEDHNGPRKFVYRYGDVDVWTPAQIVRLTGDPSQDMEVMQQFMGGRPR